MLERITSTHDWPWVERLILSRNKTGSLVDFQGYSVGKVSTWLKIFWSPKWLAVLLILRSISGLNHSSETPTIISFTETVDLSSWVTSKYFSRQLLAFQLVVLKNVFYNTIAISHNAEITHLDKPSKAP